MNTNPYLRAADDGTYELVVTSGKGRVHVLPYCFHTEEDALTWLSSRKGREAIHRLSGFRQSTYAGGEAERALG
jgi:hypothetical protein